MLSLAPASAHHRYPHLPAHLTLKPARVLLDISIPFLLSSAYWLFVFLHGACFWRPPYPASRSHTRLAWRSWANVGGRVLYSGWGRSVAFSLISEHQSDNRPLPVHDPGPTYHPSLVLSSVASVAIVCPYQSSNPDEYPCTSSLLEPIADPMSLCGMFKLRTADMGLPSSAELCTGLVASFSGPFDSPPIRKGHRPWPTSAYRKCSMNDSGQLSAKRRTKPSQTKLDA